MRTNQLVKQVLWRMIHYDLQIWHNISTSNSHLNYFSFANILYTLSYRYYTLGLQNFT